MADKSYQAVMGRRPEIMRKAVGIDYDSFESGSLAFDYETMMSKAAFSLDKIREIQRATGIGNTPLLEMKNLTALARHYAAPGKGARIFVKDEACNPSGSFKARRASVSAYYAKTKGYPGLVSATSGNYGAGIASQAAMLGLKAIVVQEVFDSRGLGQPEILEKGRACEAYGAEVLQLTVGPELFYTFLLVLEETGFFNASLYTPFSITGIETLGVEIAEQCQSLLGKKPDVVVATNAGGGNLTGTARGLIKAGCADTKIVAASVDLSGLHMASDKDFNRKSFTTGHTGFGVPFTTSPDRADVPRNAARPLRYMDRYVTITQGEVFFMTEALAQVEGLERGPAGNTSLAAAFSIAQEMDQDQIVVVQETEYTGAGKHPSPQLTFASANGIEVRRGDPKDNIPGQRIVIPENPGQIKAVELPLEKLRQSYLKHNLASVKDGKVSAADMEYLAAEINLPPAEAEAMIQAALKEGK
ncbi:PLP-dependent lyase/thiolase [Deltaproteobacteria bacterium Smac51]|nr:PLP-dependent lyase/thiolase [Deltaproteobacteria bacterium Smac51]